MKCPKCGFVSFDYLNTCKKCGLDLRDHKAKLGITSTRSNVMPTRGQPSLASEPAPVEPPKRRNNQKKQSGSWLSSLFGTIEKKAPEPVAPEAESVTPDAEPTLADEPVTPEVEPALPEPVSPEPVAPEAQSVTPDEGFTLANEPVGTEEVEQALPEPVAPETEPATPDEGFALANEPVGTEEVEQALPEPVSPEPVTPEVPLASSDEESTLADEPVSPEVEPALPEFDIAEESDDTLDLSDTEHLDSEAVVDRWVRKLGSGTYEQVEESEEEAGTEAEPALPDEESTLTDESVTPEEEPALPEPVSPEPEPATPDAEFSLPDEPVGTEEEEPALPEPVAPETELTELVEEPTLPVEAPVSEAKKRVDDWTSELLRDLKARHYTAWPNTRPPGEPVAPEASLASSDDESTLADGPVETDEVEPALLEPVAPEAPLASFDDESTLADESVTPEEEQALPEPALPEPVAPEAQSATPDTEFSLPDESVTPEEEQALPETALPEPVAPEAPLASSDDESTLADGPVETDEVEPALPEPALPEPVAPEASLASSDDESTLADEPDGTEEIEPALPEPKEDPEEDDSEEEEAVGLLDKVEPADPAPSTFEDEVADVVRQADEELIEPEPEDESEPEDEDAGIQYVEQVVEKSGFAARALALMIDMGIIGSFLSVCLGIGGLVMGVFPGGDGGGPDLAEYTRVLALPSYLLLLIMTAIYFVFFHGSSGQTIGKMVVGARVVDTDGNILGYARAFLRYVGWLFSTIIFFLGFVWAAFDFNKQGWHDKLAHSCVIKTRTGKG